MTRWTFVTKKKWMWHWSIHFWQPINICELKRTEIKFLKFTIKFSIQQQKQQAFFTSHYYHWRFLFHRDFNSLFSYWLASGFDICVFVSQTNKQMLNLAKKKVWKNNNNNNLTDQEQNFKFFFFFQSDSFFSCFIQAC